MTGHTKLFAEQRILKTRALEDKQRALQRSLVETNILTGHSRSENRVDTLRRARSEAAIQRDLFTDYQHVTREQDRERRTKVVEAEERLANELAKQKSASIREEMKKRRICDGSEEIRNLKERLHAAQVTKERAQQLMQKQVSAHKDRVSELIIAEHMENQRLEQLELVHKLDIEKMKQRERVKIVNQQQIARKEATRQEAQVEYDKEKLQVDDLVRKIQEEDHADAVARAQKAEETKEQLKEFAIQQKARQAEADRRDAEEIRKIEEYANHKAEREQIEADRKAEEAREKERRFYGVFSAIQNRNKEREELEQLRNDLYQEEWEAMMQKREEVAMRKKLEDREDMRQAFVLQMKMKEEKREREKEEELKMRQVLLDKFAQDDRIEQMNDQKRRMKVLEHIREVDRLCELRRQLYVEQREKERGVLAKLQEEEQERHKIIEEERKKLLMQHAPYLKDFLPKGTMESWEDFQDLFPEKVASKSAVLQAVH
mmetsp:Transcript_17979/g.41974  ORF Transcript_17979/g.41974 Transcript_17979/m.41974 type:complete len:489 (-) Transcript_17979:128-1594(-)|eukprot:CAMPEP_0178425276 /NCGR_PEP_ID=MMETSP0689_2-20121128/28638_1 /TAXON_ID=160604 /ORGANISM="Amphidinium massartii, Strain CS-259" /LENGTH=488 /DNA_ID=CAMNT_0020046931 /DNA_START=49 /DNA_END=1515 /DNA_ORIENTATION=-